MENKQVIYDHSGKKVSQELKAPTFLKKSEIGKLEKHIETKIGKTSLVFHELLSQIIHTDVYLVDPTPDRDFYTLVTLGMSALPMNSPNKESQYIELMISLPKEWRLQQEDLEDERNYWPIRLLKTLSRFPFEYETWLGFGHTIPNGNPASSYSSDCHFTGVLLLPSVFFKDSWECHLGLFKKVRFYTLHPIYPNEMEHKIANGVDSILGKFDEYNLSEVVNIERREIKFT